MKRCLPGVGGVRGKLSRLSSLMCRLPPCRWLVMMASCLSGLRAISKIPPLWSSCAICRALRCLPRKLSSPTSLDASDSMMYVCELVPCLSSPGLPEDTQEAVLDMGEAGAVTGLVLEGVVVAGTVVRGELGNVWLMGAAKSDRAAGEESGPLGDSEIKRRPGLILESELTLRSLRPPRPPNLSS